MAENDPQAKEEAASAPQEGGEEVVTHPNEENAPAKPFGPKDEDSPKEEKGEDTEPFVSSSQSLADQIEESVSEEPEPEPDSEGDEGGEEPDEEEGDASESLEGDDGKPETAKESDGKEKSNVQKRIDQLTAEKKTALEENAQLKDTIAKMNERLDRLEKPSEEHPEKEKEEKISEQELMEAISKAVEEGDSQLIIDVMDYKIEQATKAAEKRLEEREKKRAAEIERHNLEWQTIVKEYSPEGYENETLKSNADFDIRDQKSALYKLAEEIYMKAKPKKSMSAAVQEAFIALMKDFISSSKKKGPKKPSKETDGLKNRLAKEQRKRTVASGPSSVEDAPAKPKTDKSELDEVLSERHQYKKERTAAV